MMRLCVKSIIDKVPGFEIVAHAVNGKLALGVTETPDINLILLDIEMPGMMALNSFDMPR